MHSSVDIGLCFRVPMASESRNGPSKTWAAASSMLQVPGWTRVPARCVCGLGDMICGARRFGQNTADGYCQFGLLFSLCRREIVWDGCDDRRLKEQMT